jgi:hypothetical protein
MQVVLQYYQGLCANQAAAVPTTTVATTRAVVTTKAGGAVTTVTAPSTTTTKAAVGAAGNSLNQNSKPQSWYVDLCPLDELMMLTKYQDQFSLWMGNNDNSTHTRGHSWNNTGFMVQTKT